MKLLFDQNLSPKLPANLSLFFPGSIHVRDLSLERSSDIEVWEEALKKGYTIVTKDIDYTNFVAVYGFPPKVIWIRRGNCSTNDILSIFLSKKELIKEFAMDSSEGILLLR